MKNFLNFLAEAKESQASAQARRLGLKGDGHGGWYNTQGEFIAKTVGGELKFYTKGQKVGEKDTPNTKTAAPQPAAAPKPVVPQQQKKQKPAQQEGGDKNAVTSDGVTVVFAKFNPPTSAHERLLNAAEKMSSHGDFRIYPSRTQDSKQNPLDPDTKIKYMKKMYPKYEDNIINNENMKTLFDVLAGLEEDGYTDVTLVVGSSRLGEFKNLSNKYNGDLYNFNTINVVSVGKDIESGEDMTAKSPAAMIQAVTKNDYPTFRSGIPKALTDKETKGLFSTLKKSIGGVKENWEMFPKIYSKQLRENYVSNKIFKIDSVVENQNTGLVGKIIRRGTNYLICVTEDNIMFKSWIYDVTEWTDQSGVPANQREVGTDALRKYTMKMTGTTDIKNFINKYKKKVSNL
jgi:hypothetical protein